MADSDNKNKKIKYFNIYGRVLKNYFKFAPVASVFTLINYIAGGLFPAFTAITLASLFDEAYNIQQGGGNSNNLVFWGLLYLIAYVANNFLIFITELIIELGADKRQVQYRYLMCAKLSRMPLIDFENSNIKDMQQRAEEHLYGGIMDRIVRSSLQLIFLNLLNFITLAIVLAKYSLWFLPLCLVSVLPYSIARLIRGKEFYYIKYKMAKKSRRLGYLWGLFTDRRTVKELRVLGADDYVFEKWTESRDDVQNELWEQNRKDAVSLLLCDALRIIGYGACIVLALVLTLNKTVNVGVFGACIAAFFTLQSATRGMLVLGGELPRELAFAGDYFEYIDLPEELSAEESGGVLYSGLHDKIELRNISFKYPNSEKYAVKNVSFEIHKGEKIAILGENGSGKTTLSKLLLGLFPCEKGEVLYNGKIVKNFDKPSFYKTVSAIAQNFTQYKLPLRENIAMSDINSLNDDEKITGALKSAGLNELLDKAGGLDNELGTAFGGSEISGGQWQKIAIARGLFRESEFIVMDEPTSALDPLIETEILTKFIELAKDKTAIIISHRVGLCRLVDKIAVMKNGEIAEIGKHDELLAQNGEYTRLFTAQEKWYREN
ncbi:MAG: ABC transporter ATP-binding protein/permease [Oscillospiraceae bacterium]|nr:ABC transporter ATP-binding protein/permease [Oscillospiraceae bacterium]